MGSLNGGDLNQARTSGKLGSGSDFAIRGRAMLAGGTEFPCRVQEINLKSAEFIATARVEVGQVVVCSLDYIGILPGRISTLTRRGFILDLRIPEDRRGRVSARLDWYAKRRLQQAELRGAPRIVPKHRAVEVRLGENILMPGTIQDISLSGAAIDLGTDALPFVGSRVRVGARYATVVRLIPRGIAVQFAEPFAADSFADWVRP
ncbi:hypothetical protein FMGBMHLM_3473 [Methylobacterium aerolatum]|nr:hypothetical protein FMGBMHLM_3473 [Methylobacterium aerolatum]